MPTEFKAIQLITDQPVPGPEDTDLLGMGPFARVLAGVALGTDGPFNIGVYGGWGVGKTSMLQVTRELIEKQTEQPHVVTVWFNAWQYEREEHPLFPLIAAIIEAAEKKASECDTTADRLCAKLTRLGSSLRALTRGMKFSGKVGMPLVGEVGVEFDADKALKAEELIGKQSNPLQGEMLYQSAFEALEAVTKPDEDGPPPKVVIFIDDLDRCLPDKALELLESIKLVLNQKGFIFLLGLDHNIVTSYLAKCYREQYGMTDTAQAERTASTYLHKIVQLQFDVPHHEQRFPEYVAKLLAKVEDEDIAGIGDVLIAGTDYNPRSLVRLANNLIIDWTLWQQWFRKDQEEHNWGDRQVLTGMAITRVLQQHLGFKTARRLALNEELLAALLDDGAAPKQGPALFAPPGMPLGMPLSAEHDGATQARADETIMQLLREHGAQWLQDVTLRKMLFDFYRQREASWEVPESQQAIFIHAVEDALGLKDGAPLPKDWRHQLLKLDLGGKPEFNDVGLQLVQDLRHLESVELSGTRISSAGVRSLLTRLPMLKELGLSQTSITDDALPSLTNCRRLSHLALASTQISDDGLRHLGVLANLRELDLSTTSVSDAGLKHLAFLAKLAHLKIGGTQISDHGLQHLGSLEGLEFLELPKTRAVTGFGFAALTGLSRLMGLTLTDSGVSDDGIQTIAQFSTLRMLMLANTAVSDQGLRVVENMHALRTLWLTATKVTDDGMLCLARLMRLENLALSLTAVSDESVDILLGLPQLDVLLLEGTAISSEGISALAAHPSLSHLQVTDTQITQKEVASLNEQFPRLYISVGKFVQYEDV